MKKLLGIKGVKYVRKIATLFLLVVSAGLLFAGAISAQDPASVDVTVIDENGDLVTVASPGDEVAADVIASAGDEGVETPWVEIFVDPDTGMQFEPEDAMMWDGTQWIQNDMTNYPNNAFFFWFENGQVWVWDIAYKYGDLAPGDITELIAPAIVSDTGDITANADLWGLDEQTDVWYGNDSYTFLSVANEPVTNAGTVPMQNTGAPLAALALGFLGIIGGAVYGKLR
jgi:hypothetical protein